MLPTKTLPPAGLWAITAYFNPVGYRRRLANYRVFRQHLGVPLLTVELAFDRDFELRDGDAERLIQLRGGDVLWQKERLLNVALAALPLSCHKVVWLDCDVLIGGEDWPQRVIRALDEVQVAQAFSRVYYLKRDTEPARLFDPDSAEICQFSISRQASRGEPFLDLLRNSVRRIQGNSTLGFAWAARREFLQTHGFYDACIIGGGDTAFVCALQGCLDEVASRHLMNESQRLHYVAWAKRLQRDLRKDWAFVDASLFHLWHGDLEKRGTQVRHRGLSPFQFDPLGDLAHAPGGAWKWSSAKPDLHQYVKDYLAARKEDG